MKKVFILVLLTCCIGSFSLKAQITALPTDSAMYVYLVGIHENGSDYGRDLTVKVKGDTLLNGKIYSKVYYAWGHDTLYNSPNNLLHCFIRSDTNLKAYVRYPLSFNGDTSDILLYDFKQQIGDTFNFPVFQSYGLIEPHCDLSFKYVVTSEFTAWDSFFNSNINYLQYSSANDLCTHHFSVFYGFRGSADFIFYNELPYCNNEDCFTLDSLYWSESKCYWYKGKWSIPNCLLLDNDIKENESPSVLTISPNPFNTSAQINFNQTYKTIALEVVDIEGKLLLQNRYADCKQIELKRGNLMDGLYFLKLTMDGNKVETRKIVISE